MSLYVLDTDHLSLQQRGDEPLCSRLALLPPEELAITVISIEEVLRGRLAQIREAKREADRVRAYGRLIATGDWLQHFQVLNYDEHASRVFVALQQQRMRIGTRDLRIAAITLSVGATLLTRNAVDFSKVPGLALQDWTV